MRKIALAMALAAIAFSAGVDARSHHYRSQNPSSYNYYNGGAYYTAASGDLVHRPVQASSAPDGATARCYDGTYSFSESRRGTCSHHGGVANWL